MRLPPAPPHGATGQRRYCTIKERTHRAKPFRATTSMRQSTTAHVSEPLSHFVEEHLACLYEMYPTAAAADGFHTHDDLLEDLSRPAVDGRIRELGGWARRLDGISPSALTPVEALERRMLAERIRGHLFALEELRDWQRNPLHYADTLADSLAGQTLFAYADLPERARRVGSKLRQVPRFLETARQNVTEAPGLFVRVGIEAFEGVLRFVEHELPRAFRDLEDMHLLGVLADTSMDASDALREHIAHLRDAVAPRSRASFRLGRKRFEQKLKLDEGLDVPVEHLLDIARRELHATQDLFSQVAAEIDADTAAAWRRTRARHPAPDTLLRAAGEQVEAIRTFLTRNRIVSVPEHAAIKVRPTPDFRRGAAAGLWMPGPFEAARVPACYHVTNVDPSWLAERQEEHLRDLNYAALSSIAAHEAYPGRLLHGMHLRAVSTPCRKTGFFAARSFVAGWSHYAGQMVLDEGFERGNPEVRLGQLAEKLLRLARTVVGIRLHAEDLSVEQGVRFFCDEAFLEEANARREAERATFDPDCVLSALGRLMVLKLRADVRQAEGGEFSLPRFHDRLLGQGCLPFWMHRALMAADGPPIE